MYTTVMPGLVYCSYYSPGNKERELFAKGQATIAKSCLGRVEDYRVVLCGHLVL